MRLNQTEGGDSGISISVPIPAKDPNLYGREATDEVLLFLSKHRFEQFSQRELSRQVEYSESGVRNAVDILEENGLVETKYKKNEKLVGVNRNRLSVPDDPLLRIPQQEYQKPVKKATEMLKRDLKSVVGIVLYGSIARGEADRRSDIDLWVVVQEDRAPNQREANNVTKKLENKEFEGQRYDFHIAVEAIESVGAFADNIQHIIRTGIPVYETETFVKLRNMLAHGDVNE